VSPVLERDVNAAVRAGLFPNREEAVAEAINVLFAVRPAVRLETAIELLREGEVSLSRAAEMAGTDRITFRKLLTDRGVPVVVECDAPEVLDADIATFFGE